jgi:N-acetylglucosaminyl-diphospho-decaprenol L-rhamnosyltransferase
VPSIDVVVPVHGKWELTAACLDALASQTVAHRVVVVDDASPDDTLVRLAERGGVDVVALERNRGFAAACNAGIAAGSGEIVVLFNNDVVAEPDLLERLVEPFADPAVGSATPLLTAPDGSIDAFGIVADRTMAGFVRLHGRPLADAGRDAGRLVGPYGAVAAYRRAALDEVGVLDEGIFMYGEELDLALRLSAAGWRPAEAPAARGVHLGGGTSGRGSAVQRRRAGFGRGYLLRAYGVLASRAGARALVTELIVCAGDAVLNRDLAAARGRLAGWRAGRHAARRTMRIPDLDPGLGFVRSLRMRLGAR